MSLRTFRVGVLVVLLLAAGVRFYRLDHQSFWNDEGNTARLSERSIPLIIEGTASDVHPPLYYLLISGWRQFTGDSEFSLRSFSGFAGVLIVATVITIGRLWYDRPTALLAGIFVALSPPLIYYSQEARMYALHALWAVLLTVLLLRGWGKDQRSGGWLAGYVLVAAAGLYTHYAFPAVLVVHSLWVVIWIWGEGASAVRRQLLLWGGMMAAVGLLYVPWLPIFLGASGRAAEPGSLPDFITRVFEWYIIGPTGHLEIGWAILPLCLLLIGAVWPPTSRLTIPKRIRVAIPLLLWITVPAGLMFLVGATTNNYLKFLTTVVPGLHLLMAAGLVGIGHRASFGTAVIPVGAIFTAALLPSLFALNRLYFDPSTYRDDYRALAAQITAEDHPNAAVVLNAPNQWEVFTYYYKGPAEVYPFPRFVMEEEVQKAELSKIAAEHERLYAVFWGERGFDPQGVTERWLDEQGFKVVDEFRGDLRYVMYALPAAENLGEPQPYNIESESGIVLQSAAFSSGDPQPGDVLQIVLNWQATESIGERYKVFLHVMDESGAVVAQRDSEPMANTRPTSGWEIGESIRDPHGVLLPLDLPPGAYRVLVGLYPLNDPGNRLKFSNGIDTTDAWELLQLKVDRTK